MDEQGAVADDSGAESVVEDGAPSGDRGRSKVGWAVAGFAVLTLVVVALLVVTLTLAGRVDTLESDLDRTEARVRGGGVGIAGRIDALEESVADLEASPGGAPSAGSGAVEKVVDDIDALKECVNEYMDVIGRWSTDVSTRYDYLYC